MNISEANATNVVLRALIQRGQPVARGQLTDAAVLLAEKAYRALSAGITPDEVRLTRQPIADVAVERASHTGRGWTAEHDRHHGVDHLVELAETYIHTPGPAGESMYDRASLVKAASLLIAAVDLLDVLDEADD